MKFLIIEDEVLIAEVLKDYIRSFGYTDIEMAHDKKTALRMIEEYRPHIILLDIRMEKETDGLEIGNWINLKYNIPFIYITAHSDLRMMNEIMSTMPAGYVSKPVKKADLLANIIRLTNTALSNTVDTESLSKADRELILKIESYLRENIYNSFDGIDSIAQKFNISTSKLKTNFKLLYDKPIYQYYSELQMKEAFKLIKNNQLLIKEVAARFGYESQGRFSEAFKKVNGILPSELK